MYIRREYKYVDYTNLKEPRLALGNALGMRDRRQVSRVGAEPPILGVAVDSASWWSLIFILCDIQGEHVNIRPSI